MNPFLKAFCKIQFGGAVRAEFYQQMISMLRSGRSKTEAARLSWRVASFDGEKKTDGVAIIYDDIASRLEEGDSLGEAVRTWVPAGEASIISAMENSENFADSLESWLRLDNKRRAMIGESISELMHPAFLLLMAYFILIYFGNSLMPTMDQIYPMENWTGLGAFVGWLAIFIQKYAIISTVIMIAFFVFIGWSMPRWSGFGRKFFDKLPPWSIYRTFAGINFLVGVAALMQGRIPELVSVRKLRQGQDAYMASRLDEIVTKLRDGNRLGTAMFTSKYVWPDKKMTMTLKIYEETADLSNSMVRMSDTWLGGAKKTVAIATRIAKMFAMLTVAVTIMIVMGGTFAINQQISEAFGG